MEWHDREYDDDSLHGLFYPEATTATIYRAFFAPLLVGTAVPRHGTYNNRYDDLLLREKLIVPAIMAATEVFDPSFVSLF